MNSIDDVDWGSLIEEVLCEALPAKDHRHRADYYVKFTCPMCSEVDINALCARTTERCVKGESVAQCAVCKAIFENCEVVQKVNEKE